ncbi:MAG: hypothetical protein R6V06_01745 [Kiritimatiellia bacterium]
MRLMFARLKKLTALCFFLLSALLHTECNAAEISDAELDALFNRHSDSGWSELAERWDEVKAEMTSPVENLSLPVDYHANGRMRAKLFAARSQIFEDGTIFASGVRVNLFDDKGNPAGYLKMADCIFERESSHGYCKGEVNVKYGADILSGEGMYFSISGEYIRILSHCKVRTKRFQGNLGRLL